MDQHLIFTLLLLIHIGGAIIGFGPTFAFAILGPMAGRAGPQGGIALLEAMVAIEHRLTIPVAAVTQPLSGIGMVLVNGYAADFFSHRWLWIAILIYIAAFYTAIFVSTPNTERMVAALKAGPPTPEFAAMAARSARLGPLITIFLVTIITLMVTKPGG